MHSNVTWIEGMAFSTELDGHTFMIDSDPAFGGEGKGPKPKGLVLSALAGCTAMDVLSILGKMRIKPEGFSVTVSGDLTEEHPKVFSSIHITYKFKGKDLPKVKLEKAVELSMERYCGVSAMLKKLLPLTHEISIDP